MQMNVQLAVPMVNLTVAMDLVSMALGHVTVMVTVPMALMKMYISVVSLMIHVLMTIVKMAHIGMAGVAILVYFV